MPTKEKIIISRPNHWKRLKKIFKDGGAKKIHIVSDFDRTLTRAFNNGKSTPSLISVLRDGNHLTPEYAARATALFDKYHAIEIDSNIPMAKKKKKMLEWWRAHFKLLIKSKLNKKDVQSIAKSDKVKLRAGVFELTKILEKNHIPMLIISSGGLGSDAIRVFLKNNHGLPKNIFIISNSFEWNKKGYAVAIKEPIIHSMNKNQTVISTLPFFRKINKRKNVILLGDTIGDTKMTEGLDYENIIKIGFLNEDVKNNIPSYKKRYDILILNDGSMKVVNKLIQEITDEKD